MLTRLTALPWLLAAWLLLAGTASAQIATYAPVGPQNNVPLTTITGGGWTECHRETFNTNTPIATISAACNKAQMMMACTNDDTTIQLLAQAPKADVMFDTGTGNVAREANGSAWYFSGSWSWGFAPGGAPLNRSSCDGGDDDTFSVSPDPMRMCIHTGSNNTQGGWRCGSTTGNNGSAIYAYRRIFFHADGAVAGATVPGAPTAATAVAGNTQATVTFTAPASDGGAAITGYRVVSSPGNVQATGPASPIVITGLTNGTSYTFTVFAINSVGDSLASAPSNAVVPVGPPTLSNFADLTRSFGDADFALTPPTSDSAGAFTYTSSNPAVATINGDIVTIVAAGSTTITASQAADGGFTAGSITATLTVGKAAPNLAWIADIFKTYGEADFDLADPTSASPGAFTFSSADPAVATVSGRTVSITGSGSTVLTATQAETANYAAGSVTTTLRVEARPDPTQDPGVVAGVQAQVDASVRFASAQQTNVRDRLRQVRSGSNASSNALSLNLGNGFGPGLSLNAGQAVGGDMMPLPEGWGWWTAGAITFGDRDARVGSSAFGFQSDGLSFGLDRRVGENALLGVSLGKGFSDADFDADNSSLGGDYKSLSVYGLWRNDRLYVDGLIGAGQLDFDIRRYSALVNDYGIANREGDQQFASLTVGHEAVTQSMRIAAYGRFDASRTDLDAYRETGLGIYDLSYTDQQVDTRTVSIGAEGSSAWSTDAGVVRPYWMLEYRQSLKDESDLGINYVILPNASDFLLRLSSYADDAVVWGGGLDLDIGPRWGLALLYRGEYVSGVGDSYSVGLQLSWKGGTPSAPVSAGAVSSTTGAASTQTRTR